MSIAAHIEGALGMSVQIVKGYLGDLTDADMMVRPGPNLNHLKWQVGHLIFAEHYHIGVMYPNSMPALPEGFKEQHNKDAAASDDPAKFCTKARYFELMDQQREGMLKLLRGLSDEELSKKTPEQIHYMGPTIGAVFANMGTHWTMHAGQWAVVRRKLGKPPLF
jgi:hypothetical protein